MKKGILLSALILCAIITNGQTWLAMGAGLGAGGQEVRAVAYDPVNGTIYAGGNFTGGVGYIARWNASSSAWEMLGTGINGQVNAIVAKNSEIYVGGSFTSAGGVTVNNVAKWFQNTWSTVGSGFNAAVNCLMVSTTGTVYAGGQFVSSGDGSATYNHVAQLSGSNWAPVGNGITSNVLSLAYHNNTLYAGTDNGISPVQVFSGAPGAWSAVSGISGGKVSALASFKGSLYAGGEFSSPSQYAAKYTGSSWGSAITSFNGRINAFFANSNILIAVGNFQGVGVSGAANYVGYTLEPTQPFRGAVTANSLSGGEPLCIAWKAGIIVVGGRFTSPGNHVVISSGTIGIDELSSLVSEHVLYPNPVKEKAILNVRTVKHLAAPSLQIMDANGRVVRTLSPAKNDGMDLSFDIEVSGLAAGRYHYLLTENGTGVITDEIIVE